MDRCRRCGHQLSDDELREREYDELLRAKSSSPKPVAGSDDGLDTPLF